MRKDSALNHNRNSGFIEDKWIVIIVVIGVSFCEINTVLVNRFAVLVRQQTPVIPLRIVTFFIFVQERTKKFPFNVPFLSL